MDAMMHPLPSPTFHPPSRLRGPHPSHAKRGIRASERCGAGHEEPRTRRRTRWKNCPAGCKGRICPCPKRSVRLKWEILRARSAPRHGRGVWIYQIWRAVSDVKKLGWDGLGLFRSLLDRPSQILDTRRSTGKHWSCYTSGFKACQGYSVFVYAIKYRHTDTACEPASRSPAPIIRPAKAQLRMKSSKSNSLTGQLVELKYSSEASTARTIEGACDGRRVKRSVHGRRELAGLYSCEILSYIFSMTTLGFWCI